MRGAHSHRRSRWFASLLLLLLMLMAETVRIAKTTINFLSGALPKNRHHKASFSLTREDSRMRGEAKEGERERESEEESESGVCDQGGREREDGARRIERSPLSCSVPLRPIHSNGRKFELCPDLAAARWTLRQLPRVVDWE